MKTWLLDTGPIVAFLDRSDPHHQEVIACLGSFRGKLITTSAVVTEAMHFVASAEQGPAMLAELLAASRTQVYDLTQPADLRIAAELMHKYRDTPMDFPDATLVMLATASDKQDILTLDRRGFSTYRCRSASTGRARALRLVLDR